MATTQ